MKSMQDFERVYLHRLPVDGRKWINGLAEIIESTMELDAFDGSLFAFTNRRRSVIKLVYWDRTGFALWMKRLEEEKFRWPLKMTEETITLTPEQLSWLLEGIDLAKMKPHASLRYQSVS